MISGTPVLMYALDGVPQEYWKYGYFIGPNGFGSLEEGLAHVLSRSEEEHRRLGDAARDFVLRTKNGAVQTQKILKLLERV